MGAFDYLEQRLLALTLNDPSLGALPPIGTLVLALHQSQPADNWIGEWGGYGEPAIGTTPYRRQTVKFAPADPVKRSLPFSNSEAISVTGLPAGTYTHFSVLAESRPYEVRGILKDGTVTVDGVSVPGMTVPLPSIPPQSVMPMSIGGQVVETPLDGFTYRAIEGAQFASAQFSTPQGTRVVDTTQAVPPNATLDSLTTEPDSWPAPSATMEGPARSLTNGDLLWRRSDGTYVGYQGDVQADSSGPTGRDDTAYPDGARFSVSRAVDITAPDVMQGAADGTNADGTAKHTVRCLMYVAHRYYNVFYARRATSNSPNNYVPGEYDENDRYDRLVSFRTDCYSYFVDATGAQVADRGDGGPALTHDLARSGSYPAGTKVATARTVSTPGMFKDAPTAGQRYRNSLIYAVWDFAATTAVNPPASGSFGNYTYSDYSPGAPVYGTPPSYRRSRIDAMINGVAIDHHYTGIAAADGRITVPPQTTPGVGPTPATPNSVAIPGTPPLVIPYANAAPRFQQPLLYGALAAPVTVAGPNDVVVIPPGGLTVTAD